MYYEQLNILKNFISNKKKQKKNITCSHIFKHAAQIRNWKCVGYVMFFLSVKLFHFAHNAQSTTLNRKQTIKQTNKQTKIKDG